MEISGYLSLHKNKVKPQLSLTICLGAVQHLGDTRQSSGGSPVWIKVMNWDLGRRPQQPPRPPGPPGSSLVTVGASWSSSRRQERRMLQVTSGEWRAPGGTQGFLREATERLDSGVTWACSQPPASGLLGRQSPSRWQTASSFTGGNGFRWALRMFYSGCRTLLREGPKQAAGPSCFQRHWEGSFQILRGLSRRSATCDRLSSPTPLPRNPPGSSGWASLSGGPHREHRSCSTPRAWSDATRRALPSL